MVLDAGRGSSPLSRRALSTLCEPYWFPLYAYLRRRGSDAHEAEDHTQAFFTRLLEKQDVRLADPARGKFRSFLLASLNHFLANERDHRRAQKRGGGQALLSLDFEHGENQYGLEPADELTPEKLFDRSWALTVLDQTMARLQEESAGADQQNVFDRLKVYLTEKKGAVGYREVGGELGMTEGAVKVAVHRLRGRYRELLREEIGRTVATEDEVEEEMRDLLAALAG